MNITDKITITNDDCFLMLDKVKPNSVDLLLVDTPYGMSFKSNHRKEKHLYIENDNNLDWLPNWLLQIKKVVKEDSHCYIFCSNHFVDVFISEIKKVLPYKNMIIWEKNNTGMGDLQGDYAPKYELIIFCSNGKRKLNGRRDSNIIKAKRTDNELHPTQKPVNLMEYLIEKSTSPDELVMDCFSGSGTTAVACHNTNRRFIGCEIEKEHFDTSVKRLFNHIGQQKLF
jgi:DNA modification methylase